MIYKITNAASKEWNGKNFTEAILVDTNSKAFKVSAWAGEFDGRAEIDLELEKNDKGYWKIKKAPKASGGAYNASRTQEIVDGQLKVQKEVTKNVQTAQDRTEYSIKISSTMNKAVEIAVAEYTINKQSLDRLDECILKWRRFLWNNWNVDLKDIDPLTDQML